MQIKWLCMALTTIILSIPPENSFSRSHRHHKTSSWCDSPGYTCVRVRGGDTWYSLFPDDYERGLVMRINHTNGSLYSGLILKVPENIDASDPREYAPVPAFIKAEGEKVVIFDPKHNAWGAYDSSGELVRWGPATGGKDYCPDINMACRTKPGIFRIYSMGESNCVSRKFPVNKGGAPMPYCMFFNGGQAFHGSPGGVVKGNVSHGCVRLFVSDAEWLRYDFVEGPNSYNNYRGTKVIVLPYGGEAHARDRDDEQEEG